MPMHADPPPRVCATISETGGGVRLRSFNMMIRTSRDSIECVRLEGREEGRKECIIVEHWIPFPFRALAREPEPAAAAAAVVV